MRVHMNSLKLQKIELQFLDKKLRLSFLLAFVGRRNKRSHFSKEFVSMTH